jgi:hypothetical protein
MLPMSTPRIEPLLFGVPRNPRDHRNNDHCPPFHASRTSFSVKTRGSQSTLYAAFVPPRPMCGRKGYARVGGMDSIVLGGSTAYTYTQVGAPATAALRTPRAPRDPRLMRCNAAKPAWDPHR